MKIGAVVTNRHAVPFTLMHREPGTSRKGTYYKGLLYTTPAKAVIWPSHGTDLLQLPEAMRTEEAMWFITTDQIRTAEDPSVKDSDLMYFDGVVYQAMRAQRWVSGGFFKVLGVRVSQDSLMRFMYVGIAEVSVAEDDDAFEDILEVLSRQMDVKPDLYFQAIIAADESVVVALPTTMAPTFRVDDVASVFTIARTLVFEGVNLNVWQSPTLAVGSYMVEVS